jgi:hypothetical protein
LTQNLFHIFLQAASRSPSEPFQGSLPAMVVVLFCVALTGCAAVAIPQEKTPVQPPIVEQRAAIITPAASLALSAAAIEALASAEQAITAARRQKVLWTRAAEAFALAQGAARRMDSDAALRLATEARELANLGIQQKSYPPLKYQ